MHQVSQLYIEPVGLFKYDELLDMSSETGAIGDAVGVVMYGYSNPARHCCRG
jgi:hypothetical protein